MVQIDRVLLWFSDFLLLRPKRRWLVCDRFVSSRTTTVTTSPNRQDWFLNLPRYSWHIRTRSAQFRLLSKWGYPTRRDLSHLQEIVFYMIDFAVIKGGLSLNIIIGWKWISPYISHEPTRCFLGLSWLLVDRRVFWNQYIKIYSAIHHFKPESFKISIYTQIFVY